MGYPKKTTLFTCLFVLIAVLFIPFLYANDKDKHESHQLQADEQRRRTVFNARRDLGYSNLFLDPRYRGIDFLTLSYQISRIGAFLKANEDFLRQAEEGEGAGFLPAPPPPILGTIPVVEPANKLAFIYGPSGPNSKSVKLLLEYHLMVAGNERLKLGKVIEHDAYIIAQIVTKDNSLVEEYLVDKKTGTWKAIR